MYYVFIITRLGIDQDYVGYSHNFLRTLEDYVRDAARSNPPQEIRTVIPVASKLEAEELRNFLRQAQRLNTLEYFIAGYKQTHPPNYISILHFVQNLRTERSQVTQFPNEQSEFEITINDKPARLYCDGTFEI